MSKKRDQRKRAKEISRKTEQHRKNREAKIKAEPMERLKPKRGELPSAHVMDAISDGLHAAVTSVFEELEQEGVNTKPVSPNAKMKGRCLYYAAAGQYVAEEFLGREYWVQVGSLGVMTDDQNMIKIDAAAGGIADRRFHMWLGTDDGGFVEHVDFTSRFFQDWALAAGAKWERADLPAYLWGKKSDIPEKYGVCYQFEIDEEPEADRQIQANETVIDMIVRRAKKIVRERLSVEPT